MLVNYAVVLINTLFCLSLKAKFIKEFSVPIRLSSDVFVYSLEKSNVETDFAIF